MYMGQLKITIALRTDEANERKEISKEKNELSCSKLIMNRLSTDRVQGLAYKIIFRICIKLVQFLFCFSPRFCQSDL